MPDTITSRLKLLKAAGTSLIKVKEHIDDAFDIIDDSVGIWDCTAATHPVTNLFNGKLIREVDTGNILRYDLPSLTWICIVGPLCHLTPTTPQNTSAAAGTFVAVACNTEVYDTNNMHDNAVNNTRITAPVSGYYRVTGKVYGGGAVTMGAQIYLNGVAIADTLMWVAFPAGTFPLALTTSTIYLIAGQYIELFAASTSASVPLGAQGFFEAQFVRP